MPVCVGARVCFCVSVPSHTFACSIRAFSAVSDTERDYTAHSDTRTNIRVLTARRQKTPEVKAFDMQIAWNFSPRSLAAGLTVPGCCVLRTHVCLVTQRRQPDRAIIFR